MSDRKRSLNDLRVIDLRAELEKRNLDKNGIRGVLIQRLSKYLTDEGHDPSTYKFEINGPEPKTPSKKTRRSESTVETTDQEDAPAMEDMIVQDDAGEEEEPSETSTSKASNNQEESMESDEVENKTCRKREVEEKEEAVVQAKKLCVTLDKLPKVEDDNKAIDNTDAEDSINLDIGDDELLNEETDNTRKPKKDEIAGEAADGGDSASVNDDATTNDTSADPKGDMSEAPATSENNNESKDVDIKDEKNNDDDKKEKKDDGKEGGARNLWVSGLSGDTRAKDLKQLCSQHGKVIGAKVVTNARTPGSRCYGYVTMASAQDAESCIKNLHRTELHGRMISVEKAKSESESSTRRQPAPSRHNDRRTASKDRPKEVKDDEEANDNSENKDDVKSKTEEGADGERSTSRTRDKSHRSDKDRARRTRSQERKKSPREVLSFSKIWKERDMYRARERSRAAREEERRRRAAEEALRDRERRQRQEKQQLALEREKLRAERERIEREKNELLRLERERHRLEREKLEFERLELKRAQLRLEEERRKRAGYESSATYRKSVPSPPAAPAYERDARHKRPPPPTMSSSRGQFEAPPPPRFEISSGMYDRSADKRDRGDRDYKRDYPRHVASGNLKYPSNGNTNDESRQPLPPGTRPKEPGRSYESREGRSYRPSPPAKPEPRSWSTSNRYNESAPQTKGGSEAWAVSGGGGGGGGEARYAGAYEQRYPAYQPPPPGAAYPDRYAPPNRDYRPKY